MNLKELADSLNLSQTTVSRALNGYPEVREETRDRVLKAAQAANYQPNSRARRLATGRSMAVGHVIPLSDQHQMVNPIFADFLAGAGEVCARVGYDLVLSVVAETEVEAAYRKMASNGSVDGLMVHGPRTEDPRIALLQSLGLPFIVHGRSAAPESYSWLDIENRTAFRQATDLLLDLGHRRIGLLNGFTDFDFAHRRQRGYEQALDARGVAFDEALVRTDEMTESFGYRAAKELLARENPVTAMMTSSVLIAVGARRAVAERGWQLGREVSLVTHDDVLSYLPNAGDGPAFTATRSPVRAAGSRAAEMLMELIDSPNTGPRQELWPVEITLGRTTGPCLT
ncbi:MAG: substrate-binding domain-containing protein [Pseudomonadota bacterium]